MKTAKEHQDEIICKLFDLEETFEKASHEFRDLARMVMRYRNSKKLDPWMESVNTSTYDPKALQTAYNSLSETKIGEKDD